MSERDEHDEKAEAIFLQCKTLTQYAEAVAAELRAGAQREAELRREVDRLDYEAELNCQETVALSHEVARRKEISVDNELELSGRRVEIVNLRRELIDKNAEIARLKAKLADADKLLKKTKRAHSREWKEFWQS